MQSEGKPTFSRPKKSFRMQANLTTILLRFLRKKIELLMAAPPKNLLNGTSNMERVTDEDITSLIIA